MTVFCIFFHTLSLADPIGPVKSTKVKAPGPLRPYQTDLKSKHLEDPLSISVYDSGWKIDPRRAVLSHTIPLATVPGPIPIPVAFRLNGSFRTRKTQHYNTAAQAWENVSIDMPVYGAVHFGFAGCNQLSQKFKDAEGKPLLLDKGPYVMESGRTFTEDDFVDFGKLHNAFTLAEDFGLAPRALPGLWALGTGDVATYIAKPADFGKLQSTVEANLPQGFGNLSQQYIVVMDKAMARIYVLIGALNTYAPVLWLDRFGHQVLFKWQHKTQGLPEGITSVSSVEALNHLGKGVLVQWAECAPAPPDKEQKRDLVRVDFIGLHSPAMTIEGYTGITEEQPEGTEWPKTECIHPKVAGPYLRPTKLRIGDPGTLEAPTWLEHGKPLPSPPSDGTQTAASKEWQWDYDTRHAEITGFTDHLGVVTQLTIKSNKLMGVMTRVIKKSVSEDPKGSQTFTRTWKIPDAKPPRIVVKETFGKVAENTRSFVYTYYDSELDPLYYWNGDWNKFELMSGKDAWMTVMRKHSPLGYASDTRVIETHTQKRGEASAKVVETPTADMGLGTFSVETSVEGKNMKFESNVYDDRKDKLEPSRLQWTSVKHCNSQGQELAEQFHQGQGFFGNGLKEWQCTRYGPDSNYDDVATFYTYDEKGRTKTYCPNHNCRKTFLEWEMDLWAVSSARTTYYLGEKGKDKPKGELIQADTAFDSCQRPLEHTDERGVKTKTVYDLYGRPKSVTITGQNQTTYEYSEDHRVRTITCVVAKGKNGPAKTVTKETSDGFGRLIRRENPDGTVEEFFYDEYGRPSGTCLTAASGLKQPASKTLYDPLNRPVTVQTAGGALETFDYTQEGPLSVTIRKQTITGSGAAQNVESREYRNGLGQVVKSVAANGSITEMAYDGFGNLVQSKLTPSGGGPAQLRSSTYDSKNYLVEKRDPETGLVKFKNYNAQRKPQTIEEASGRQRTLTYDGLGRLLTVQSANKLDALLYGYTGPDLTRSEAGFGDKKVTKTFEFSGPGKQMSLETLELPGFNARIRYDYDTFGALASLTYPSGRKTKCHYDALGRMNGLSVDGVDLIDGVQFNEWGKRSRVDFASGAYDEWTYKNGLHLDQWTVGKGGRAFPGGVRRYHYDSAERLTQAGEWNLLHNPMGQLTQADFTPLEAKSKESAFNTRHAFDGYGNQAFHQTNPAMQKDLINFDLAPMADNKIPGLAKNNALTGWKYNPDGEAQTVGLSVGSKESLSLGWDGLGRLASATKPGIAAQSYLYDASGMRVSVTDTVNAKHTRVYVYTSGGLLLEEYTGTAGKSGREVFYLGSEATAEIDPQGVHELHKDHLGTPRIITSGETGEIEGRQAFGAYGESLEAPYREGYTPLTGYTGHIQTDATGLIYMKGRYYSPAWHRFVNSDKGVDLYSPNQFTYCIGSPMMAVDPNGMFWKEIWDWCTDTWSSVSEFFADTYNYVFNWFECSNSGEVSAQPSNGSSTSLMAMSLMMSTVANQGNSGKNNELCYQPNTASDTSAGSSACLRALPFAGALAVADGPFPIGDAIGICIMGGALTYDLISHMSKGGIQNKENEWSRPARQQPDPCQWLREQYENANDPITREKIKTAQKVLGCRKNSTQR